MEDTESLKEQMKQVV
jgi:hypothetical protein